MKQRLFEIIFEHDDFIVVNKSSGLLSIPDREGKEISLKAILQEKRNIYTVHRIDRDTSGLIVFAKNENAHRYFSQVFENKLADKFYLGIVHGIPQPTEATIEQPIMEHPTIKGKMTIHAKGKNSITEYSLVQSFKFYSLLKFKIITGRTHQIRVHSKFIGHPIVCDEVYGDGKPIYVSSLKKDYKLSLKEENEKPILNRLGLHSFQLAFKDDKGKSYFFEAPLPKDMRALIKQLEKYK